jgi:polyisoprenoid-binding protein YceI
VLPISIGPDNAALTIRTEVEGRASRFGHRLTITFLEWSAKFDLDGEEATRIVVTVNTSSLKVTSGEGGVTPLSDIDRSVILRTALRSLQSESFPQASFSADSASRDGSEYTLSGNLEIAGQQQPCDIVVTVSDGDSVWQVSAHVSVLQTDFNIKPYSAILGSLKVADGVQIELTAEIPKPSE